MLDREKVIAGLEFTKAMITFNPSTGEDIEPENLNEADKTTYDACVGAIALLKEQEKAKVVFGRCKDGSFATECGHCGTYLDKAYSICPKCNKELDWNSNQK